jgi:hypothetical protein
MIRSLDAAALRKAMVGWLASPPPSMRAELGQWAERHGVVIA